jgi:rod shape-determining protein MreC
MLKRTHYIALGVVLLVTLVVLKLPTRTAAQLKLAISGLFLPLFGLAGTTHQATEKAGNAVVPRRDLLKQLEELQKENQELRIRALQAEVIAQENARLRQQLGVNKKHPEWKLKLARVVARDPANWWRTMKIDLGTRDGVTTNCPVLTPEGLVGRVADVGYAQAQVVLVGDPDCRVSVLIEETRDQGVIAPASSSPLDDTLVDLGFLSRSSQLKAGQKVVTSGLGGIFPQGIVVGQIVDFHPVGYGLYTEARVKLQVKMNTLEEVWVKVP